MWLLFVVLHALYYIAPAYVANSSALIFGGGTPIDFGRKHRDGKRIFGDGKTWRGFFSGVLFGTIIGYLWYYLSITQPLFSESFYGVNFFMPDPLIGLYLGSGALIGDIVKSYFKRRMGVKRGGPFWGWDQLDFVIGALVFGFVFSKYTFVPGEEVLVIFIITPAIHLISNGVAFVIKRKDVWW